MKQALVITGVVLKGIIESVLNANGYENVGTITCMSNAAAPKPIEIGSVSVHVDNASLKVRCTPEAQQLSLQEQRLQQLQAYQKRIVQDAIQNVQNPPEQAGNEQGNGQGGAS